MDDIEKATKNGLLKLASLSLSISISSTAAAMAMVCVLFIVEMPLIKKTQTLSALIFVIGCAAILVIAVTTFRKINHYLFKYMQIKN